MLYLQESNGCMDLLWGDLMKKLLLFLLIITILLSCTACDNYAIWGLYPDQKADRWYCEELNFEFYFPPKTGGTYVQPILDLVWEGKTYPVTISFQANSFDIYLADDDGDGVLELEDLMLEGSYRYRGKQLIFKIITDNLFGGEIKELVFVPVE